MFSSRSLALYGGHKDEINCLVFSCDFEILLTGSINGCIRIWNTVYNHLTFKIQERKGRIRALAISNNDKYFASAANDIHIRLYETRTGSLLHLLEGHTYSCDCVHFSSDSQFIASGAWDCRTILWDVITGKQLYNFHHHTNAVQSIAFHPSRNIMLTGSYDHLICLYNFEKLLSSIPIILQGHYNNVCALAFSYLPYFASAGCDKAIIIWHIETQRIQNRLFGHEEWIQAISFRDNDGSILASVDNDTVYVWNILTGLRLRRLRILNDLTCFIRFLPNDGGLLVGGTVYELLFDQQMSFRERLHTKRVCESFNRVTELMSLPKDRNVKLPRIQTKNRFTQ